MSRGWLRLAGALWVVGSVAACQTRDRLTFLSPDGNGSGPTLAITAPHRDTTISVGDTLNISGYAIDPDGVDSIWFSV
ncbi:MAG: Ig-like domain-containing protein, partial [Gemmatimonadales bacterium]